MNSGRWRQIEEIFNAAVELPEKERETFVKGACFSDAELMREVKSLLQQDNDTGVMLKTMISQAAESLSDDDFPDLAGKRIGPYRIQELIGRGGMAGVYSAIRDDDQYNKKVAIKLIPKNPAASFLISRFWHERQILANLEHPCIARFLEGGTTEDGITYLVMEYIEGQTITEYCKTKELSLRKRLELFRLVCDAVQYAHRNLVIHRDLKPSNILVNSDGVPKLLDFGIAKLLNPELVPNVPAATITSIRLMTPEYASPEQVRGEQVTTATDVYSLGAVLYELLSGERPHHFETRTFAEIERVVCQREPERPSLAVMRSRSTDIATKVNEKEKLSREFARELDNIVLKAMQKSPIHRYHTAEQFAEDIERYLDGRPVRARTATFGYRAMKFAKRHKFAVISALALAMTAMLFVTGIMRERSRAEESRKVAELEASRAKAVKEFLQMTLVSADPFGDQGRDITLFDALQAASKRIEEKLKNQPEIEAEVRDTIGLTFLRLGHYVESEQHLEKALEIRKRLYGTDNQYYAATLDNLGTLYREKGALDKSEKAFRESLAIWAKSDFDASRKAIAKSNLGDCLMSLNRFSEAQKMLTEGHAELLALRGPDDRETKLAQERLSRLAQLSVRQK